MDWVKENSPIMMRLKTYDHERKRSVIVLPFGGEIHDWIWREPLDDLSGLVFEQLWLGLIFLTFYGLRDFAARYQERLMSMTFPIEKKGAHGSSGLDRAARGVLQAFQDLKLLDEGVCQAVPLLVHQVERCVLQVWNTSEVFQQRLIASLNYKSNREKEGRFPSLLCSLWALTSEIRAPCRCGSFLRRNMLAGTR
jgi:hypothetical protein